MWVSQRWQTGNAAVRSERRSFTDLTVNVMELTFFPSPVDFSCGSLCFLSSSFFSCLHGGKHDLFFEYRNKMNLICSPVCRWSQAPPLICSRSDGQPIPAGEPDSPDQSLQPDRGHTEVRTPRLKHTYLCDTVQTKLRSRSHWMLVKEETISVESEFVSLRIDS